MAAAKNQQEVLEYLVKKGANINYVHPVTTMECTNSCSLSIIINRWCYFYLQNGIDMQKKLKRRCFT